MKVRARKTALFRFDLSKAFDYVPRTFLMRVSERLGMPKRIQGPDVGTKLEKTAAALEGGG